MGRKTRHTREKDLAKLVSLLERRSSGTNDIHKFHAKLCCAFDLDSIGRFLWRVEQRTLTSWNQAIRAGTYDDHPFSGWRAGTPKWSDPIPVLNVATDEYSYDAPFCKLEVWISRSLQSAEIDRCGHEMLDEMKQNRPTMNGVLTAIARLIDDRAAGRKAPLTASRVLADRLSRIQVPTDTSRRSIALIRCATPEAALLELG